MAKTSEAQLRATVKYSKQNIRQFSVKLNKKYDADLIAWLDAQGNRGATIKTALKEKFERSRGE